MRSLIAKDSCDAKMRRLLAICLVWTRWTVVQSVSTALSSWQPGIASLYGGDIGTAAASEYGATIGSCGYADIATATWPFLSIAALPTSGPGYQAGPVEGCGTCYQISCVNDGSDFNGKCDPDSDEESVTVQITDSCPECAANQFDVQAGTFGRIAPEVNGRISMLYRRVTCTPSGFIQIRIDGNVEMGWLRLWVYGVAGAGGITSVSIRTSSTGEPWLPLTNTFGAAFEVDSQPAYPSDLEISTDDGQTAVIPAVVTSGATGYLATGVQLSSNPAVWTTVSTTTFNPQVEPGSTSDQVISEALGPGASVESESCDFTTLDINFSQSVYSCQQQRDFGKCNSTFLNRPVKLQDLTLENYDPALGYCHNTCKDLR